MTVTAGAAAAKSAKPAATLGPAATARATAELRLTIRGRLDAYAKADANAWVRYVAEDCLCAGRTRAELQQEMQARTSGVQMWYGEMQEMQARIWAAGAVVRYRVTEHSRVGGQELNTTEWHLESFERRGSQWLLAAIGSNAVAVDPPSAVVDPTVYDSLVGRYRYGENALDTVWREGNRLMVQSSGQPQEELFPIDELTYFAKGQDWRRVFVRDAQGQVVGLKYQRNGQELNATRLP